MGYWFQWSETIEERGFGEYIGSVKMIYNIYRRNDGFKDIIFERAIETATKEKHHDDFIHRLIELIPNQKQI